MSARDAVLNKVRAALKAPADSAARRRAIEERMAKASPGVIPLRGQLPPAEKVALFCQAAEGLFASVQRLDDHAGVPKAVMAYLRKNNLPASVRIGGDPLLAEMPWASERTLDVKSGPTDGDDLASVSHAFAGIAETGTLVLLSGQDNPTTLNFLPEHHIVVMDARDVVGDLETALAGIRARFGKGIMPRTVNLISGPSRSGDIEQKLVLGAHGPKALHILVVGEPG